MTTLTRHQIVAIEQIADQHDQAVELSVMAITHRAVDVTVWGHQDQILATYTVSSGGTVRDQELTTPPAPGAAMTRQETIRSLQELTNLMGQFFDDRDELAQLAARTQVRLDQLKAHVAAGRPDLRPVA